MTNVIDFAKFKRGNTIETTATIKEESIMNTNTISRQSTFANIGTSIANSSTVEEALVNAKLDYEVHKTPIFTNGIQNPRELCNLPNF